MPFDSVRKRVTTVHRVPHSRAEVPTELTTVSDRSAPRSDLPPYRKTTRGAVDGLLEVAASVWLDGGTKEFDDGWPTRITATHDDLVRRGMHILGVGVRFLDQVPDARELSGVEQSVMLVGLAGMIDPPRPEVGEAVRRCRLAGIRPVMITGNHPLTALHIARQVGIADSKRFVMGQETESLSAAELRRTAADVAVFARVSPEQKIRLIEAFQDDGNVVVMTGDGVNDAQALNKADIGVAMGISGTDVVTEASNMVLPDDNFATIVAAVRAERALYDNFRRFIKYVLARNSSETAVMLIGPLLGMHLTRSRSKCCGRTRRRTGARRRAGRGGRHATMAGTRDRKHLRSLNGAIHRDQGVPTRLVSVAVGRFAFRASDPLWQTLPFTKLIFSQLARALGVRPETSALWTIGLRSSCAMFGAIAAAIALQVAVISVPVIQAVF